MANPGPAPQPTALKLIKGNPGQRALNDAEPVPPAIPVGKPDWLSPMASAEWDRVAPQLEKMRILSDVDVMPLAAYCEAVGRFIEASRILETQGALVLGYRGSLVKNPAAQIVKDALADMKALAQEFGMTPSSRSRVKVPDAGASDDLDGLLS